MTTLTAERYAAIPLEMRQHRQWCWHRLEPDEKKPGKIHKIPRHPGGTGVSCKKPAEWRDFAAVMSIPNGLDGISYVMTVDAGLVCIDLDDVRNPESGEVLLWAQGILDELDSYTELSASGRGYHVWVKGSIPKNIHPDGSKVEMYSHSKIMAMTGNVEPFRPETIEARDLTALFNRVASGVFSDYQGVRGQAKLTQAGSAGNASADDWKLVAAIQKNGHFTSADALDAAVAAAHPDLHARRNREKGPHGGKPYFLYTAERYLKQNAPTLSEALKVITEKEIAGADTDLPEGCLDGWLGQVCTERMSAFPRAYAWLALLAGASVLVPRDTKFRCNLYVDLDGPVHSGKSSAFEMAFHLLSLAKPTLLKMKAGSAEGLAEYVGDAGGAARLLYPDELAHLLEKSMIERSSFARFLTSAFYDDEQELTVAKRKPLVFKARLSLAGGTVDDQFGNLFGSATTGGLYDRFLFGKCPTGYQYLWRPIDDEQPAYVPSMAEDGLLADTSDRPVPVCLHSSVFKERDRWIKEMGIEPRVAELCLRAATICASFDGRRTLTAEDLGPALELAKYQMRVRSVLRPNPGENPDARMSFTIRNWMAKHDGWIGRRLLYKVVSGHRLGPGVFDRALRAMEFNGEVESDKVGKQTVVRLVPDPSASTDSLAPAGTCATITPSASTSHAEEVSSF